MAEEVRPELPARGLSLFGPPVEPTTTQVVLAVLLSYGPYLASFVASIFVVFNGPFADFEIELLGWLFNYLLIGAVWGLTLFPRLFLRSRIRYYSYKIKGTARGREYKYWNFDLSELQFLGKWFGMVLAALLVVYIGVVYALLWPLAVILEVALWADRED